MSKLVSIISLYTDVFSLWNYLYSIAYFLYNYGVGKQQILE